MELNVRTNVPSLYGQQLPRSNAEAEALSSAFDVRSLADVAAISGAALVMRRPAERLERYLQEQLAPFPPDSTPRRIAAILLAAALHGPEGPVRRHHAVRDDGTPVLLSYKETGEPEPFEFRLHVEPGLPSLRVSEQIDLSLTTIAALLDSLRWQSIGSDLYKSIRSLYPARADEVDRWRGGIGVGCAADAHATELRIYCNVRTGPPIDRWHRFATLAATYGGVPEAFMQRVSHSAEPVGVAICLRQGRVAGLRLYLSLVNPSASSVQLVGEVDSVMAQHIDAICAAYPDVAPLEGYYVGAAFDFAMIANGRLDPTPRRFKADFVCHPARGSRCEDPLEMRRWVVRMYETCGLRSTGISQFLESLDTSFGGAAFDYISVGRRGHRSEMTAYVIPAGLATVATART